jgi:hypothetical protein
VRVAATPEKGPIRRTHVHCRLPQTLMASGHAQVRVLTMFNFAR